MKKLKMHSKNKTEDNIRKIGQLFPNCVTETINDQGNIVPAIDFDLLKQELSAAIINNNEERYQLMWPDKKASILLANTPIAKTLRPCREESVHFDRTENLYIEGNNLDVLKLLQETYLGKIRVIYIDPPYNTGNDILYQNDYGIEQADYEQRFERDAEGNQIFTNPESNGRFHTDWLNMMYQRIRLAKDLLTDDGFFLVSIDHNELFNLGEICDEIFGYKNRIGIISVVHKPEGRNQAKFIGPSNEFMFIYAKNENLAKLQKVALDDEQANLFSLKDDKGNYRLKNFIRLSDGKYSLRVNKPGFWYPIWVSEDLQTMSLEEFEGASPVYPITESGVERTWKTSAETFLDRYYAGEIVAKKEKNKIVLYEKLREDQVIKTHWINKKYHGFHFGTKILDELLGVKTFDFPKSLYLMKDIFKLCSGKDDIILDFFSGSATSAHAIMQLNAEDHGHRKYIMVQIAAACDPKSEAYKAGYKNICEIGKERIRRSAAQIRKELPHAVFDDGFRVLKLDSTNMKDVYYYPADYQAALFDELTDNIKEDRTPEDLLFQVMLDLGVLLSSTIEENTICGKKVFTVSDNFLIACFDENITEEVIREIAQKKPDYFVMRDSSMADDSVAINFDQIFATYSPATIRKVI